MSRRRKHREHRERRQRTARLARCPPGERRPGWSAVREPFRTTCGRRGRRAIRSGDARTTTRRLCTLRDDATANELEKRPACANPPPEEPQAAGRARHGHGTSEVPARSLRPRLVGDAVEGGPTRTSISFTGYEPEWKGRVASTACARSAMANVRAMPPRGAEGPTFAVLAPRGDLHQDRDRSHATRGRCRRASELEAREGQGPYRQLAGRHEDQRVTVKHKHQRQWSKA